MALVLVLTPCPRPCPRTLSPSLVWLHPAVGHSKLLLYCSMLIVLNIIIIIINNRGLNARWCLTPLLLSLPTAAYLGQRGLTPARLPHTTAQCHLTILGEAVLLFEPSIIPNTRVFIFLLSFILQICPKRRSFFCITFCSRVSAN